MFRCDVCGSLDSEVKYVNEVFIINNKPILVENIPATICSRCNEITFSRETTERIRRMVHGESKPQKILEMEVFSYAI